MPRSGTVKPHGRGSAGRQVVAIVVAWMIAFAATAPSALGHGCGTSDHWSGGPHYFQYEWNSGNSHFHRWYEVNLGSGSFTDTFCGCINPKKLCYYGTSPA